MLFKRLFKHLRLIILIAVGLLLGIVIGGIYTLNQTGVNDQWRHKIAIELENLGIIADFDSLRYDPTRGMVAEGVRIYADSSRKETVARLKHLVIDVDKTKLMRGKLRVNNVSLKRAEVSMPINPNEPDGPRVVINKLQGDLYLPDKNTIEAQNVKGMVAGIHLELKANIWGKNLSKEHVQTSHHQETRINRIKVIAKIIQEISRWSWPENKPPKLKIYVEGNLDNPDSSHIDFELSASSLERDGVILSDVRVRGDYHNKLITLDQIQLDDGSGKLIARADFHPNTRKGRFEVTHCKLHLQKLTRKLLGLNPLHEVTFSTPPQITCSGEVRLDSELTPQLQLNGKINVDHFHFKGIPYQNLESELSLQGSNLFLTNLKVTHSDGEIHGRLLLKDNLIRYDAQATLPVEAYRPFITNPKITEALNKASFTKQSKIEITTTGSYSKDTPAERICSGHVRLQNFTYKEVPMRDAVADFAFVPGKNTFANIRLTFDYQDYPLRKTYGGPSSGRVDSDQVVMDLKERMVHIKNIRTTAWPAPVVRLFASKAADHCEQYRFLRPPGLSASGSFDLNQNQKRTDFKIDVHAPGSTHYRFLGETLSLKRLRGHVRIRQGRVDVSNLSFYTFQGPCKGKLTVHTIERKYAGELQWSRLHLKDIGQLYHFKNAERGLITGRIDFSGKHKNVGFFNGKGSIALERGNLFSIPMLGPLSPVIGSVLGDKNPTNEHAENASCTFAVRNGVVYSDNFLANTRSLRFTGEGKIDLNNKQMDMMVRMNARGLFSLISLPLKPLMGMFQFAGTGNISKPQWKTTIFTSPKRGKKDPIFRRPPKARVIGE
ncbi:hypothetical protein HW115_03670 [Verrucomicrobiaceae bacterium N1E253]|uniref:AsmA-like C-terminal domain-containing protein n=1 Tax=Oceaniferula marina TaxID=2748318 RepID=A0A851GHH9_9BACT|nr:AsmA-like C-terminal region-containing protein [Oceaniferula marina]NWK54695.1 hypothetical protein [Oceaniferula marina]